MIFQAAVSRAPHSASSQWPEKHVRRQACPSAAKATRQLEGVPIRSCHFSQLHRQLRAPPVGALCWIRRAPAFPTRLGIEGKSRRCPECLATRKIWPGGLVRTLPLFPFLPRRPRRGEDREREKERKKKEYVTVLEHLAHGVVFRGLVGIINCFISALIRASPFARLSKYRGRNLHGDVRA